MIPTTCVSHILYRAWDRDKSFEFFVESLGFYPQKRGRVYYCGMGDTLIEILAGEEPVGELTWESYVFGVQVPNVEEAVQQLVATGTKVLRPIFTPISFYGLQAVIDVPGGPPIALREYRDEDGPHFMDWKPTE